MADYQIPPTCNTQKDLPICYRSVQIAPGLSPNGSRDYQQHRPVAYHLHITSSRTEQQRHRLQFNLALSVIEMAATTQENLLEDEEVNMDNVTVAKPYTV